jgi:hypothetical protein
MSVHKEAETQGYSSPWPLKEEARIDYLRHFFGRCRDCPRPLAHTPRRGQDRAAVLGSACEAGRRSMVVPNSMFFRHGAGH